jgi:ABC-type sugar transport system permease subunit
MFLVAPGALIIAILLDKGKGQGFFRSVYFYPFTVVMVAAGIIWGYGFRVDGFINEIIGILGISSKAWLGGSGKLAMPALIFTTVWRFVGYFAVIYLSGLQSIPEYLYDAAIVDGANPIQTFWHVTVPQLKPITLFIVVMSSINLLRQFAIPKVMTDGGPFNQTNVLSLEIYKQAFTYFNINQAAAGTIILIILATGFSIIQFKISKGMRG